MARLTQAIERAEQALASLQAVISIPAPSEIERDAAIQRFEFTFEAIWKTGRHFLREVEGIDDNSPTQPLNACAAAVNPLRTAPSKLAGQPVSVQSPANHSPAIGVWLPRRNRPVPTACNNVA